MVDSGLKHYIGSLVNDLVIIHKSCSPEGITSLMKIKALTKVGPFKTIPTNSSLDKVVLVRRSKLLYLFAELRSGSFHRLVGMGSVAAIEDPQVLLREIEGESTIFPALKDIASSSSGPSKRPRYD